MTAIAVSFAALAAGRSAAAPESAGGTVAPALGWLAGESGVRALHPDPRCAAPAVKSGPLAKLDRGLVSLFCNPEARRASEAALVLPSARGEMVVVDAAAAGNPRRLAQDLKRLGARRISTYGAVVSAQVPVARLDALAGLATLRFARPFAARVNAGTVTGQHVQALAVSGLQAGGLDGSGVSIGVLSDSFDCLGGAATDIANGDLPAGATALLDEAGCASGTDEGRAMMQLIHDLVPGATQTFHTAFGGAAGFANGIQALAAAGATVIVDDVSYFAEPMFQDGIIAQSVDDVATSDGVAYFSSAGNNGSRSYESAFRNSLLAGPFGGRLHDFDPGAGVDTLQNISLPSGITTIVLNWDQPYFSASGLGGSTTDLDFHLYNSAGLYLFSAALDNMGGDPIEILSIDNTGGPTTVNLAIEYFDGPGGPVNPIATVVKYVAYNSITVNQFATNSGTAYGHSNADGAMAIGAANYFQTPPFGVDPAVIAGYSSHGGVPIYFDLADTRIGPITRGKPEVVGPDGANTTFFGADIAHATDPDTFPNFFGTSASAPAVAAIGALMRQSRPTLTPPEVETCLTRTAADMGAAGYDVVSGTGYVRSAAALACANGDWGDLPAPYATLESADAARHVLDGTTRLGAVVDRDDDGQPNASASGDDGDGSDDEDGVTFATPLMPGRMATVQVSSTGGFLSVFVDFNGNGVLGDAGETLLADQPVTAGTTQLDFAVPAAAVGTMASRFRLTAAAGSGGAAPTGTAPTGEVEDYLLARLGNQVWEDQNGDGDRDAGEPFVGGVTLELLDGAQNPVLDGSGTPITTVSSGAGTYAFPGLPAGTYRLRAVPPAGFAFTLHNVGGEAVDSDVDPATGVSDAFTLTAGLIENRLDVGLVALGTDWGDLPDSFGTSSASGGARHTLAFQAYLGSGADQEGDGTPSVDALGDDTSGGDEDGVVFLDPIVPGRPARIQVTASQAGFLNAWIDFDGDLTFGAGERVRTDAPLGAGTSEFQVVAPAGSSGVMYSRFRYTLDDPAGALGPTGAWANGEVEDYALAALGDRVWNDDGSGGGGVADGIQNGTEPGVEGVLVRLLDVAGSPIVDAAASAISVLTDVDGTYRFPGLPPASYRVDFNLPPGASAFSPADAGGDDAVDSDADPSTGMTAARALLAGESDGTVDAGILAPTVALFSDVTAYRDAAGVVVQWSTASEAGSVAFELYRREPDGTVVAVLERPIRALISAPQGGTYSVRDDTAPAGATQLEYALAEIESAGSVYVYGPFVVDVEASFEGDAQKSPVAVRPHRAGRARRIAAAAEQRSAGGTAAAGSTVTAVKAAVREDGLTRLDAVTVAAAAGMPDVVVRQAIAAGDVRLTIDGGEVSWLPLGDTALLFYGRANDGLYSRDNVYRLEIGESGTPMAVVRGLERPPVGPGSFAEVRHFESDLLPAIAATEESGVDFWYWDGLIAEDPTHGVKSFTLDVPGTVAAGSASLTVDLAGGNRGTGGGEHTAVVRVNGESVGSTTWSGKTRHSATFPVDVASLGATTTVEITAAENAAGDLSIFFVDAFDLAYPRALTAAGDRLEFVMPAAGVATVDGFTASDLVALDVDDPAAPILLTALTVDLQTSYRGTLMAPAGTRILMTRAAAAAPPFSLVADQPSDLRDGDGAEYLVVTTHDLLAAAQELADYRQADGLTTRVIDIEDVYDEFGHSQATPWALREMLAHALAHWSIAPRYLVLAGAGTFDPRDLLGAGDNLLTPLLAGTPQGLAAADNRLADVVGDDGVPELAVGRIPVLTAAELSAYVAKVVAFETTGGAWRQRALLVADDSDAAGDFAADSDLAAADLPASFLTEKVYLSELDVPTARQQLRDAWNAGALLVNYVGHSGVDRLAAERLLDNAGVDALANGPRLPVMAAMTCVIGRFEIPGFDSLGARLVLHDAGGAVAVWAPSGLSTTGVARRLNHELYAGLFDAAEPQRLGDVVRQSLAALGAEGHARHLFETYGLLGDPALRVEP